MEHAQVARALALYLAVGDLDAAAEAAASPSLQANPAAARSAARAIAALQATTPPLADVQRAAPAILAALGCTPDGAPHGGADPQPADGPDTVLTAAQAVAELRAAPTGTWYAASTKAGTATWIALHGRIYHATRPSTHWDLASALLRFAGPSVLDDCTAQAWTRAAVPTHNVACPSVIYHAVAPALPFQLAHLTDPRRPAAGPLVATPARDSPDAWARAQPRGWDTLDHVALRYATEQAVRVAASLFGADSPYAHALDTLRACVASLLVAYDAPRHASDPEPPSPAHIAHAWQRAMATWRAAARAWLARRPFPASTLHAPPADLDGLPTESDVRAYWADARATGAHLHAHPPTASARPPSNTAHAASARPRATYADRRGPHRAPTRPARGPTTGALRTNRRLPQDVERAIRDARAPTGQQYCLRFARGFCPEPACEYVHALPPGITAPAPSNPWAQPAPPNPWAQPAAPNPWTQPAPARHNAQPAPPPHAPGPRHPAYTASAAAGRPPTNWRH